MRRLKDFKGEVQSPDGHMLSKSDKHATTVGAAPEDEPDSAAWHKDTPDC